MIRKLGGVITGVMMMGGSVLFAGLCDHGDCTGFPNVNVDAHLIRIARKHFPEIREKLDPGLKRRDAWKKDIRSKAQKLNISPEKLDRFTAYILDPRDSASAAAAPHQDLLEFQLYADGKRILSDNDFRTMPEPWQRLLAMPLEKRRYTTIPVFYSWGRMQMFCNSRMSAAEYMKYCDQNFKDMWQAFKAGCYDSQGCILATIKDEPSFVIYTGNMELKIFHYHKLFRSYAVNREPVKIWRYKNSCDIWRWARFRGDRFFSGGEMPALRFNIYQEKLETLREMCRRDEIMRDLIVAIGLTNYQMSDARTAALEFAGQSQINHQLFALRLPFGEAVRLLGDKAEHRQLRDLLAVKNSSGADKIAKIREYIASHPDYTPKDMPVSSIALNTHRELNALAGLEYLKIGKPWEALETWMKGGCPEDIALVAEQIFKTDMLLAFCIRHAGVAANSEKTVYSEHCGKDNKDEYGPGLIDAPEARNLLRNILARRLMREKRYGEAEKWFSGRDAVYFSKLYMGLSGIANDQKISAVSRFEAKLSLAALVRHHGDILFGTALEPDNTICMGRYKCSWGTGLSGIKLNKPELPRYHYRYIAAELYAEAGRMAQDRKMKAACLWMAGTMIKNLAPKKADVYFKELWKADKSLTENNWFKPIKKISGLAKEVYHKQTFFIDNPALKGIIPAVKTADLPQFSGTAAERGKKLQQWAFKLLEKLEGLSDPRLNDVIYALQQSGDAGNNESLIRLGEIFTFIGHGERAVFCLRKALAAQKQNNRVKCNLGLALLSLGCYNEGAALVRDAAENEKQDKKTTGIANYVMALIYIQGETTIPKDEKAGWKFLERSVAAGYKAAIEYKKSAEKK